MTPTSAYTRALRDRQRYIHTNKKKKKERKNIVSCSYVLLRNERDVVHASESEDKLCSHAGDGYRWVRSLPRALPRSFLLTKVWFPKLKLPWRQRYHHVLLGTSHLWPTFLQFPST